ncbi:MAG: ATP12 family protein, partial [Paracoccus sp. (in: a-proteobacteria)]|nr:ATP12 family protein [Paracoccus sp. (in: a-proteobacteria)]
MSEWAARRFWKTVSVRAEGAGYEVRLDDSLLRTPGKLPLILPTEALARAVAAEWAAQEDRIQPLTMPLTRAVNSTVERVMPQCSAVVEMLAEYGNT